MGRVLNIREIIKKERYGNISPMELLEITRLLVWESKVEDGTFEDITSAGNHQVLTLPKSVNEIDQLRTETDWRELGQVARNVVTNTILSEPDQIGTEIDPRETEK